jgi:hypothetical protein
VRENGKMLLIKKNEKCTYARQGMHMEKDIIIVETFAI